MLEADQKAHNLNQYNASIVQKGITEDASKSIFRSAITQQI